MVEKKYKNLSSIYDRYLDGEECTNEEVDMFKQAWAESVVQEKFMNENHQIPDSIH